MRWRLTAVLVTALACVVGCVAPAQATYPGANGKIAFGIGGQILSINPDGSNETALTDTGCGVDTPSWSPDGTKIAYRTCSDIHIMNADGSGDHFLAHPAIGILVVSPSWSPDASKIVFEEIFFISGFGSTFNIRVINADGTGNTALTSTGHSGGPDWSPDGTKIAFTRFGVPDGGIYTMNPDGSGATKVPNTTIHDFGSGWSPDGQQLTFSRQSQVDGHRDIYKINADGTGLTQLTEGVHSFGSTWSPDGQKIAFISFKRPPTGPDQYTLTLMNPDGSGQTPVTMKSFLSAPSWQPIPGPQRGDYKNAAQFCKAERDFLGDSQFRAKYGGGANAHGKCVSQNH
jgi:Tol biopolymer transport system component